MLYSRHDEIIGRALTTYGEFAESENRIMASFLREGMWALDVGANIGTVSLALANKVGEQGRVIAFEPQRTMYRYLCANAVANNLTQLDCRYAAVGAGTGSIKIPDVDYNAPNNFGAVRLNSGEQGDVNVVAIDDMKFPRCDLIKVDVEGMEPDVFAGAQNTIAAFRPVVYAENKAGPNSEMVLSFFMERGYRIYWHFAHFYQLDNFRGVDANVFGASGDINILCVPEERDVRVNLPEVQSPTEDWRPKCQAWMAAQRAE